MNSAKILAAGLLLALAGCSGSGGGSKPASGKTFAMGTPAQAGLLTYTVIHSEWKETLDTGSGTVTPKHRFLVLDISIANGGAEEAAAPLLFLVSERSAETIESQELRGLEGWLGIMRILRPSGTVSGKIAFDVPMANYKLKVSSGGDPEKEVESFIEIPLRIEGSGASGTETVPGAGTK